MVFVESTEPSMQVKVSPPASDAVVVAALLKA
jgi:hypothetical protein